MGSRLAEIRLLDREVRRALITSFPGVEALLDRSEDTIRAARGR